MLRLDRDALLCDLAETYGVYDLQGLPLPVTAALAAGLREDSRIARARSGISATRLELLLALAVDRLGLLWWAQTEDGRNNVNRPASVFAEIAGLNADSGDESQTRGFDTTQDYETEWRRLTGVDHG